MKQNFRGWTSVYGFTFRQSTKGISFKLVTTLVSLLIIGIIVTITIITAKPETKAQVEVSPVKNVYVLDNSGLQPTDYKTLNPELQKERFKNIQYIEVTGQTRDEVIKSAAADSKFSIAAVITTTDTGYQLEAVIPSGSSIAKNQTDTLIGQMAAAFESSKLLQSGLSAEQLTTVLMPVITSYSDIGENTSVIAYVIKMIAPMVFCLMFYLMLALYGQTISKSVSTEKTSKLMETLLTSVHPYALISGKILAVTTMALFQFITWIVSVFAGLYGGNAIAHALYPEYQNSVISVINFLKDNVGESALSPAAIILAILFFFIGFLFYCVIAGLAGCMVSKPEDVASAQQLFMLPIVISFLVVYLAPLYNENILKVLRYIPFTSPFSVPGDLITGAVGLGEGVLTLVVLAAFSFLIILLSGRVYKGLILYNGQKISIKMIGNILKSNS